MIVFGAVDKIRLMESLVLCADLTAAECRIGLCMCSHISRATGTLFIGAPGLAREAQCSESLAEKTTAKLRRLGFFDLVQRGHGFGRANTYRAIKRDSPKLHRDATLGDDMLHGNGDNVARDGADMLHRDATQPCLREPYLSRTYSESETVESQSPQEQPSKESLRGRAKKILSETTARLKSRARSDDLDDDVPF